MKKIMPLLIILLIAGAGIYLFNQDNYKTVPALIETDPVRSGRDAADDMCIWVHPADKSKSLIIASDKDAGLILYDLDGKQLQFLEIEGGINNVDLRYDFLWEGKKQVVIVGSNRRKESLYFFGLSADPEPKLFEIGVIKTGKRVYGLCLYRSQLQPVYKGRPAFFCFAVSDSGGIEQWHFYQNEAKSLAGEKVRSLKLESQAEGCVADDEAGLLYVGEEELGIWRLQAEADKDWEESLIHKTGDILVKDVEGLTLYNKSDGSGYLIASSQGDDSFAVFERQPPNAYITSFRIAGGDIDKVTHCDGIDVSPVNFGGKLSQGMFVTQDDKNETETQNFKIVSWGEMSRILQLDVDTAWNPRKSLEVQDAK